MVPTCVIRDRDGDLCPSDGVKYFDAMHTGTFFTRLADGFWQGFDLTNELDGPDVEKYVLPWEFFQ